MPLDQREPNTVKEFSGDVRRAYETKELAPALDILIGSDDVVLEFGIAGAVGWIAGYTNAIPRSTIELYRLSTSGNPDDWARLSGRRGERIVFMRTLAGAPDKGGRTIPVGA